MRLRSVGLAAVAAVAVLVATLGPVPGAGAQGPPAPELASSTAYDVSHPQCDGPLPDSPSFVVLGVNGGRVFAPNPCLGEQLAWANAAGATVSFYANTANPGPLLSAHWPGGQRYPKVCEAEYPANDSPGCSYDYGWNAAEDSYHSAYYAALATYGEGAARPDGDWWLDVETANSWQSLQDGPTPPDAAQDNAAAALQGAVDYLTTAAAVRQVGFYSSPEQWAEITGAPDRFRAHPVWVAGAGDRASGLARCDASFSFTGGPVLMAQYREDAWDANVRCSDARG